MMRLVIILIVLLLISFP
ncbi:type I toxin-antitoxin system toxin IbsC, partial [Escherichia coli]